MSAHIYKTVEVTGSSTQGIQQAIEAAVSKVAKTVNNLRWFEVIETRGHIANGQVAHWQVTLKIGFTLDE
ncbi:MAG: dodecin [Gammaproteobacteria bacterium]